MKKDTRKGSPRQWGEFPPKRHRLGHRLHPAHWRHSKERFLFRRFFRPALLVLLLALAGFGLASLLLQDTPVRWGRPIIGMAIFLVLSLLAVFSLVRIFRRLAAPLVTVMSAADSVARGDFAVRVPEDYPGEFGNLATSFNRMVEELARSEKRRQQLTADIAHDLRTPLHILQGNLEGMQDGIYPRSPEQIALLLEEVRILSRLINDLQTLTLAENDQLTMLFEPVNVPNLLADVAAGFTTQARKKGIALCVEANQQGATIQADPLRLSQALRNLVTNALRYTPQGGSITLTSQCNLDRIHITVRDTGSGIPEADLPFVFDRFWRGDPSRGRQEGSGSGLGLSIAKEIVQLHGGRISASSVMGEGTVFTVEIPLWEDA